MSKSAEFCDKKKLIPRLDSAAQFCGKIQILQLDSKFRGPWKTVGPTDDYYFVP